MTLLLSGLALGSVYALVAIGYNLVFISSHSFNFAQAQLMMVGAFVAFAGYVTFDLPVVVIIALAALVVAVLSSIEERIAVRPVKDTHTQLITTLGFGTILTGAVTIIWGTQPRAVPFVTSNEVITILGGRVYPAEIALIVFAVALVVLILLYFRRFLGGLALVAMSQDTEAAALRGVNVRKLAFLTFAVTGALSGVMGVFLGPKTFAFAALGASLALKGFVALAVGGFGSFTGGLIGGFAVGLVETFSARYLGTSYALLSVFALLMIVLMLRPEGLFGKIPERAV